MQRVDTYLYRARLFQWSYSLFLETSFNKGMFLIVPHTDSYLEQAKAVRKGEIEILSRRYGMRYS